MPKATNRRASARELRNHFPKVMEWIKGGQAVEITLRGKEVATLVPTKTGKFRRMRFDAAAQRKWMMDVFGDKVFTDNIVTEMRKEKDW